MPQNQLANETSPYLLQHKDNPVHWRPWNATSLHEARISRKPILLSVGYAACHWCHVMAHESFEDPTVAEAINANYIPIKVDREERPDIDQIYMNALHALGQQGGWPLTMFLTPDAEPFWGGTYFPKEARWGRPGFVDVLNQIARIHETEGDKVASNKSALMQILRDVNNRPNSPGLLTPDLLDTAANRLFGIMDAVNGGPKGAPKFPQASLLEMLWRAGNRTGDFRYRDLVLTTLERICSGGIFDHLAGGFARYAVDEEWLVPHFEKMLYDNAQLVSLLAEAYASTGKDLFRVRIEETIDWLEREMLLPDGAFAASLDADSEGEEGRFYVWTPAQVEDCLGDRDDFDFFSRFYDVRPAGNWEGKVVFNRLRSAPRADTETENRLSALRARLFEERRHRVRPALDDKVLTDWNGLMISALARASEVLDRPDWRMLSEKAFRFMSESMLRDGRPGHSWREGRLTFPGMAGDHAALVTAALALHRVTGDGTYLSTARDLEATLLAHHWDETVGGYFLTADDADDLIVRPKTAADDAIPNANGMMASNLVELWHRTGDIGYRDRADAVIAAFTDQILENAFAATSLLNAFDFRLNARQLVIVGDTAANPLSRTACRAPSFNLVISRVSQTEDLPAHHPALGMGPVGPGQPTAYLCEGETCSLPQTDPDALEKALRRSA